MPEAVIVSAVRTPIGTARKGTLTDTSAYDLAQAAVSEAVHRSGLPAEKIDDVVLAESGYGGGDIARHTAVSLGLTGAAGQAVNRHCAGGLAAVSIGAGSVLAGMDDAVVAGGVQSSSTAPGMRWRIPGTDEYAEDWLSPSHPDSPEAPNRDMSITVGWNTAHLAGVSREEQDEWALRSHQHAIAAIDAGAFKDEIVPLDVRKDGHQVHFDTDEHPRRTTTLEKLASLKPLHPEIAGFSITAGNSSGVNDAAAALTIVNENVLREHDLRPLAYIRGWASIGIDPARTGLGTPLAVRKLLERTGRTVSDIALWEINEAFAVVPIVACRELGIDDELVNTRGSGCSLGHPVAASGARMLTTLAHQLHGAGGGLAVAAMCAGGGQAGAVLIEVV
ncbi:acetyl-CoA C-acetyltransferase [Amycolatopsis bartoniae]|uniref:Probable acetyl-CoA acetyltransferase n=1 Tax=Amycolatopsis bartoniae TaxID=941986 RepID=A0A8H9ISP8_9PSEU|nr:thiolase family protein [Amycolatopsis bartoniae]MBB2939657.1 acetyl-CoA C-acetyltransferase [Amycolatopsis bartoniae]TVT06236.1 thiolase family protein [Amycolatopsis bartoniae]GHF36723.1 acetyl-CoA acetyltransferase [Amycolatopsis bartoniae]